MFCDSSSNTPRLLCIVSVSLALLSLRICVCFSLTLSHIFLETWHQQRQELNELRNRLEAQSIVISEQATRLASADLLVKDLYVENSHLTATIQRMEQQIARQSLMQQFAAQSKSQLGSMSSITGMP
jgi:hypothetical protein